MRSISTAIMSMDESSIMSLGQPTCAFSCDAWRRRAEYWLGRRSSRELQLFFDDAARVNAHSYTGFKRAVNTLAGRFRRFRW